LRVSAPAFTVRGAPVTIPISNGRSAISARSERLRVVELGAGWGVGGTEQAIELRAALLDRAGFDVHVVGLFGGPRFDRLLERGVSAIHLDGDLGRLGRTLAELAPHVVHYTRPERRCAYSQAVQAACLANRVPVVIETNVFGRPAGWRQTRPPDITAHMSLSSMLRAARLARTDMGALHAAGHRVVYLPVPTRAGYATTPGMTRQEARSRLGIAPHELLACRVTRPDLRKWSARLELALPGLLRAVPELKFALMAPPTEKRRMLERRYRGRILCLDPESDIARVQALYAASDLMIHSSGIGESFGLAMAEAMAQGLPVVVDSTPDMDNAQIELVDHGRTGFIVRSREGFVEAVRALAESAELRERMGAAGSARANERFSDRSVVAQWQRLYVESAARAGVAAPAALARSAPPFPSDDAYRDFPDAYTAACTRALGPPPTPLESGRVALIRARDVFGYAKTIGPQAVWRVVRSRLRSGSLGRD
jgi:hypothetical protein